jgi:hypothetical protein
VLGLQSVKEAEGNIIQEAPLPIWAKFRQRGIRCSDIGDEQEDGLEDRNRGLGWVPTILDRHG